MRIPIPIPLPLRLLFLAAICAVRAHAQQPPFFQLPPNAVEEVLPLDMLDLQAGIQPAPGARKTAGSYVEFTTGAILHGSLQDLNAGRQELSWTADGISAPLHFPLPMIRQVQLNGEALASARPHTLVKFTDGSWLAANVAGLQNGALQLSLADGVPFTAPRASVDWIYFASTPPGECYDGPTGLDGWESDGHWIFEEGALRADFPSSLWRSFNTLPDQVEYLLEIDQSHGEPNFAVTFQSQAANPRAFGGGIRLIVQRGRLQLVAQIGSALQSETADLNGLMPSFDRHGLRENHPLRLRVFHDSTAGRLSVYVGDRKAGEWQITRAASGANRGGFVFQPLGWRNDMQVAISRFRVAPWDGHLPGPKDVSSAPRQTDHLGVLGGKSYDGELLGVSGSNVQILTTAGIADIHCEPSGLLRLKPAPRVADGASEVAHVQLAGGGEFDARKVEIHQGAFVFDTSFGNRLTLPMSLVESLDFLGDSWKPPQLRDALLFKNGDRLSGILDSFASGDVVQWRTAPADEPVEVNLRGLDSIRLAARRGQTAPKNGALAILRNGDSLPGDFVAVDQSHIVFDTAAAGQLALPRQAVQKLYFATDDGLPVLEGAWFPDFWLNGPVFESLFFIPAPFFAPALVGRNIPKPTNSWSYAAGAFSTAPPRGGLAPVIGLNQAAPIGCAFEAMPAMAEFSFDVSAPTTSLSITAQVFSTPTNPGYVLQMDSEGVNIYDMGPHRAAQGVAQQHFAFNKQNAALNNKLLPEASQRHVRLLADRFGGKLAVVVDGVLLGQNVRKGEGLRYPLGNAVALIPQLNLPCTITNLWIGPWNGQLPSDAPSLPAPGKGAVLLENGDQADGAIIGASPDSIQIDSELGPLDLPLDRITSVDFGGDSVPRGNGARLHLRGGGTITAASWQLENNQILCHCAAVGDLQFPIASLQEIDFTQPPTPPAALPTPDLTPQTSP